MRLEVGWPYGDPILDDLDGRPRSDPDWTEPRRLTRRSDSRVWCCQTIGWVSLADAFDHSYESPPERVDSDPVGSTPRRRSPSPRPADEGDPGEDPIDSGLAVVRYENVFGHRPDPATARRPDGA